MPSWELPWPKVTTNHLWVRAARGQLRLSEAAALWRDEVIVIVRQSGFRAPAGWLQVRAWLMPPDRRRRDADNLLKLLLDSICPGLGVDDAQIRELHVWLLPPALEGRIDVWLGRTGAADCPPDGADGLRLSALRPNR